ncbi:hypothetical protein JB92DRAFT_3004272 [Gautieria morchelliformis]|nr:hypothetical protein JB92DRAFT_3004272 [Gautieria morchelliformis]
MPFLSRLGPLLGVFTGVLAFYLAETNPRTAPSPDDTQKELLRWKRDKWRRERLKLMQMRRVRKVALHPGK